MGVLISPLPPDPGRTCPRITRKENAICRADSEKIRADSRDSRTSPIRITNRVKTEDLQHRPDCQFVEREMKVIQNITGQERLLSRAVLENGDFGSTTAEPSTDACGVVKR
jgi:hypothetical protein